MKNRQLLKVLQELVWGGVGGGGEVHESSLSVLAFPECKTNLKCVVWFNPSQ